MKRWLAWFKNWRTLQAQERLIGILWREGVSLSTIHRCLAERLMAKSDDPYAQMLRDGLFEKVFGPLDPASTKR